MRIVDDPGKIVNGEILFKGVNLLTLSEREMAKIRGRRISLIFQDPTTSFNPYMTIGQQLIEAYRVHEKESEKKIKERIIQVFKLKSNKDYITARKKQPIKPRSILFAERNCFLYFRLSGAIARYFKAHRVIRMIG